MVSGRAPEYELKLLRLPSKSINCGRAGTGAFEVAAKAPSGGSEATGNWRRRAILPKVANHLLPEKAALDNAAGGDGA